MRQHRVVEGSFFLTLFLVTSKKKCELGEEFGGSNFLFPFYISFPNAPAKRKKSSKSILLLPSRSKRALSPVGS